MLTVLEMPIAGAHLVRTVLGCALRGSFRSAFRGAHRSASGGAFRSALAATPGGYGTAVLAAAFIRAVDHTLREEGGGEGPLVVSGRPVRGGEGRGIVGHSHCRGTAWVYREVE